MILPALARARRETGRAGAYRRYPLRGPSRRPHRRNFPLLIARKASLAFVGSDQGTDPGQLPHDIMTLVVERELCLADGFFGTVEAGGIRDTRSSPRAAGASLARAGLASE
jgi:hypothetical protein